MINLINVAQKISIAKRLWIVTALLFLGLLTVTWQGVLSFETNLLQAKMEKTKALTDSAYNVIKHAHSLIEKNGLSEEEAKQQAFDQVRALRYDGKTGYFWINDMKRVMLMHPIKPLLEGKDLSDLKDPTGKQIFMEFVSAVKNGGAGTVEYYWPKPGSASPVHKVSYVQLFQPWGWIVGTGVYTDDVSAAFWEQISVQVVFASILIVFLVLGLIVVNKSIVAPIRNATNGMLNLSNGDLTGRLEVHGKNETCEMVSAFNTVIGQLHGLVLHIKDVADKLGESSDELLTDSANTAKGLERQGSGTETVTSAFKDTSNALDQIVESADSAANSANNADEEASKGKLMVSDATQAIQSMADSVTKAAGVIGRLEKESEAIGSVLDVIRSIAEQTNLLALNAAIEAARAGEQGRGFAVVADEVRTLASRTQQSTEEIQEMIERLQCGTQEAVKAIEVGNSASEQTIEKAQAAARSLEIIDESIGDISTRNTDIAKAAKTQSDAAEAIENSINEIATHTQSSLEAAGRTAEMAKKIAAQQDQLEDTISKFQL